MVVRSPRFAGPEGEDVDSDAPVLDPDPLELDPEKFPDEPPLALVEERSVLALEPKCAWDRPYPIPPITATAAAKPATGASHLRE
jgi:hypothetical protein